MRLIWTAILAMAAARLVAVHAAVPARTHSDDFAVPFEIFGGHIFVDSYVNGKGPYRFAFDTGASGMGRADVRLVAELGLKKVGETGNSDGIKVAQIDVVDVKSLRLGSLERQNVQLLSRDYNRNRNPEHPVVMGIFGADFFTDRLLTIDYPAKMLRFGRGHLRTSAPGVVPFKDGFAIPVCFAKSCYVGKIDTGSNQSLVIPKSLVGQLSLGEPVHVGSGRRANTVSQMYEVQLKEPVRISGVTARDIKIRYADPSDDEINVGAKFLQDYVLTIDSRNRLLRIARPPAKLPRKRA